VSARARTLLLRPAGSSVVVCPQEKHRQDRPDHPPRAMMRRVGMLGGSGLRSEVLMPQGRTVGQGRSLRGHGTLTFLAARSGESLPAPDATPAG